MPSLAWTPKATTSMAGSRAALAARNDTGLVDGFDPADDQSYKMFIIVCTLVPFTTLFVLARFYSRRCLSRTLGRDDWVCAFSMVLIIIVTGIMLGEATTGLGRHRALLSKEEYMYYNKLFYVDVILYIACLAFIKLQVLLQYFRLFSVDDRTRRLCKWVTVICAIWGLGSTLDCVFVCFPVAGAWDPDVDAQCIPLLAQWYLNAVGNILTDFIVFCLPIPVLWRLNLDRTQRISLVAIFGLGFFTCCISIIRTTFLNILHGDETYHNVTTAGWTVGELSCAMIVSCLPTLRPLLWKIAPHLRHSSDRSGGGHVLTLHTIGGHMIDPSMVDPSMGMPKRIPSKPTKGGPKLSRGNLRGGSSMVELTEIEDGDLERRKSESGDHHTSLPTDESDGEWRLRRDKKSSEHFASRTRSLSRDESRDSPTSSRPTVNISTSQDV